jgi:hypothetical protein
MPIARSSPVVPKSFAVAVSWKERGLHHVPGAHFRQDRALSKGKVGAVGPCGCHACAFRADFTRSTWR